jgi:hypothetical protein
VKIRGVSSPTGGDAVAARQLSARTRDTCPSARLRRWAALTALVALVGIGGAARAQLSEKAEQTLGPHRSGDWGWVLLPVPFYTAKTSAGVAAALVIFGDEPKRSDVPRRDDQLKVVLQATVRKQLSLTTDGTLYRRDGFLRATGETWLVRFPNYFWGVGNDTPASARDSYTQELAQARAGLSARVWENVYAGGSMTVGAYQTANVEPGGAVADYLMTHPSGGWLVGGGPTIRRDTRDDALGAHRGSLTSLSVTTFRPAFGSDFAYTMWELDQRTFYTVGERSVVAMQAFVRYAPGGPPLDELPALGGASRMRGYFDGRYRDNLFVTTQAEVRVRVWRRLSLVPFAAVGNVFPDIASVSFSHTKIAGGLGARYGVVSDRDLNVRLDLAVAPGSFAFYLTLGEAI